jgi:PAS domain S-box-containing protein
MALHQPGTTDDAGDFRTVLDVAGVPIYTLDEDGRFTYVNTALTEASGYTRSALVGEHVSTLLAERDVERCERAIRELLETGRRSCERTVTARLDEGEYCTAELHISLLPLSGGFQGTVGVVRDSHDGVGQE